MRHVRTTLLMASQQLSSAVQWSTAQKAVQRLVPPLSFDSRKGQNGRIGVLGGSYEYTGAPYYAAQSALQAGADLAYVFCADGAAPAIKSYSPELIVLPCYKTANMHDQQATSMAMQEVRPWLARLLGALALLRDGACFRTCAERGLTSRAIGAVARDATEERLVGRHVRVQID